MTNQADWNKALLNRKCAICGKEVEPQHTPNLDSKKNLVHDYCLRVAAVKKV